MIKVARRYGGLVRFAPLLKRRHWRRVRYLPALKPSTRPIMRQIWRRQFFYRWYSANWRRLQRRQQASYPPGTVLPIGERPNACPTSRVDIWGYEHNGLGYWLDNEARAWYLVVDGVIANVFTYTGSFNEAFSQKVWPAYDMERKRLNRGPTSPFMEAPALTAGKRRHYQWLLERNRDHANS